MDKYVRHTLRKLKSLNGYICTSRFTDCVSSGLPTQTDISIHSPGRVSKRPFIESCETLLK